MLAASLVGIFVIPMLYVTFERVSEWIDRRRGIDPDVKYGQKYGQKGRRLHRHKDGSPGQECCPLLQQAQRVRRMD
jgi:hypothetical protein